MALNIHKIFNVCSALYQKSRSGFSLHLIEKWYLYIPVGRKPGQPHNLHTRAATEAVPWEYPDSKKTA
jgi:hypothetical protein